MKGAVLVAFTAAIGNLLQGWDNAVIAGSVLYIKREFNLQSQPTIEGLIVATSLIGATFITTFSGPVSDKLGRRPMLIISSCFFFLSGLVMLWAPNVYVLLFARLLDGFGIGLAVTLVPVYISETAPPEIRGLLNTFPQLCGSSGMFFSYCMVFGMSLTASPNWRVMLGVLSVPSMVYFFLTLLYLPESPRWLVGQGRMKEAKKVLQRLRGRDDVSGEMALLLEGLGRGGQTSIEEYIIGPDDQDHALDQDRIKLYGAEEGQSWIAKPVRGQSTLGTLSRRGSSLARHGSVLADPTVQLFGSIHEKLPEGSGSVMGSALFSKFGSMFSVVDAHQPGNKAENWDEENARHEHDRDSHSDAESDDNNLRSPLLSPQQTEADDHQQEVTTGMGIGGGWQLAYKKDEKSSNGLQRIYLHQEGGAGSRRGSVLSLPGGDVGTGEGGEFVHAAAIVSQSVLRVEDITGHNSILEVVDKKPVVSPASNGPSWRDLLEPGVKNALVVGVSLQLIQQFSGINGVLYYTPQMLEEAGVGVLLSNLGLSSDSASLLISNLTTLLMLPAIGVAMKLMDLAGRRALLLWTIPVLIVTLLMFLLGNVLHLGATLHAMISTVSVILYMCCFVMGFGPIPNILCAEIFPTRVRGLCIAITALTYWFGNIAVTYSTPIMLNSVGLPGLFAVYAVFCTVAWVFVYLKVPETKGMPLEVITEFFAAGAKKTE